MQFIFQNTLGKVNRQFIVVLLMAVGASLFVLGQVGFSQQQQSDSHPPLAASQFELVPAIPPSTSEVIARGTAELEGVDRDDLLSELLKGDGAQQDRFKNAVFFRIDFGGPTLPSLIVMQTADEPGFLYVDSNRDLKFQTSERMALATPTATGEVASKADGRASVESWICNIRVRPAEQNDRATEDNQHQHQHQQATANAIPVRFRRLSADQLGLATAAHLAGRVFWQGEARLAKIEDRNANGRWFDSTDRLFVDLNGDGKIDPLLERLPASGMRKIGDDLIAIGQSDDGQSIRLEVVIDRGWIEPKLELKYWDDVEIVSLEVVFASQAGFLTETKSIDKALEVPIGMWGVHSVTLAIAEGEQVYEFSFYAGANRKLHEIQSGETLEMDLLGGLELTAQVGLSRSATRSQISITPSLITESGLFLRGASIRKKDSSAPKKENRLTCVLFGGGQQVGLGSSGFS